MAVKITTCPSCQAKLGLAENAAGKNVRCPKCAHVFKAPAAPVAPPPVENRTPPPAVMDVGSLPVVKAKAMETERPDPPARSPRRDEERPARRGNADREGGARRAPVWPWVVGPLGTLGLLGIAALLSWALSSPPARGPDTSAEAIAKIPDAKQPPPPPPPPPNGDGNGPEKKIEPEKKPGPDQQPGPQKWEDVKFELPPVAGEKKGAAPIGPTRKVAIVLKQGRYDYTGRIGPADGLTRDLFGKVFLIPMKAGYAYAIDMKSKEFTPLMLLLNPRGRKLAEDVGDDKRGAHIRFPTDASAKFVLIVSSPGGWNQGAFQLSVREEAPPPPPKTPTTTAIGDVQVTSLNLKGGNPVGDLCWAKGGKAFYVLDDRGLLRRLSFPDGKEEKRQDFARPCGWLAVSAQGLVVTVLDAQEAWVLDPNTLDVKKKVPAPGASRVVASPRLSIAVAARYAPADGGGLAVLDLAKGEVVEEFRMSGLHAAMSPDGKYIFCQSGIEQLERIRIEGTRLVSEEKSHRIAQNGQTVVVSPDSKYVALPSGGGNPQIPTVPTRTPYATYIYAVDNLQKPAFVVPSGAYPKAVGFDPMRGYVFAQNISTPLLLYSYTGLKLKEVKLTQRDRVEPLQFLAHPEGGKLLVRTAKEVYVVDLVRRPRRTRPGGERRTAAERPGGEPPQRDRDCL